jgi:glutaredoxin
MAIPGSIVPDVATTIASCPVVVFSKPGCKYCVLSERLLASKWVPHTVVDVSAYSDDEDFDGFYESLLRASEGASSFPMIFGEGRFIGGYRGLEAFLEAFLASSEERPKLSEGPEFVTNEDF